MERTNLRTYTPGFRAEAVKLVLEEGLSLEETAQRLSIPKGKLSNWVVTAKRGTTAVATPGSRSVADLEAEVARLRRELATERLEKRVLKKGRGVLSSGVAARYAQLKVMRLEYPVALLCRVFGVSRALSFDRIQILAQLPVFALSGQDTNAGNVKPLSLSFDASAGNVLRIDLR